MFYVTENGVRHQYLHRVTSWFILVTNYLLFLLLNKIETETWLTKIVTWVGSKKARTTEEKRVLFKRRSQLVRFYCVGGKNVKQSNYRPLQALRAPGS
jgi:hypothetical protein